MDVGRSSAPLHCCMSAAVGVVLATGNCHQPASRPPVQMGVHAINVRPGRMNHAQMHLPDRQDCWCCLQDVFALWLAARRVFLLLRPGCSFALENALGCLGGCNDILLQGALPCCTCRCLWWFLGSFCLSPLCVYTLPLARTVYACAWLAGWSCQGTASGVRTAPCEPYPAGFESSEGPHCVVTLSPACASALLRARLLCEEGLFRLPNNPDVPSLHRVMVRLRYTTAVPEGLPLLETTHVRQACGMALCCCSAMCDCRAPVQVQVF